MKSLTFFGIIIWGIVFNSFAQDMDISHSQDSTSLQIGVEKYAFHTKKEVAKTFRPARHFLGARTGIGPNAIYKGNNVSNFAIDYDVVFRNSPLGLSFSFWRENGRIATQTVDIMSNDNQYGNLYNIGASGGMLIYIPYSKKSDNTSGFAIKPRLDVFSSFLNIFYNNIRFVNAGYQDYYDPWPFVYRHSWEKYEEKIITVGLGTGAALSLGLESRFQVAKNLYVSCGIEGKGGAISGKLIGTVYEYTENNYQGVNWKEYGYQSTYTDSFILPYISLQAQAGIGFVFRGKGKKE